MGDYRLEVKDENGTWQAAQQSTDCLVCVRTDLEIIADSHDRDLFRISGDDQNS